MLAAEAEQLAEVGYGPAGGAGGGGGGVLKEGWVTKRAVSASRPFKNWRRRYVVLGPDRISWRMSEASTALSSAVAPSAAAVRHLLPGRTQPPP